MAITATEAQHDRAPGIQALPDAEVLARLLDAQRHAAAAVAPAIPALEAAAAAAAEALAAGHRLAYAGAGSAGLMALSDALELFGTFGIPRCKQSVSEVKQLRGTGLLAVRLASARVRARRGLLCLDCGGSKTG